MKRLLWVTAIEPCFDAGGGGQIRQAHLLDAVADRFEVRLLLAGQLEDERVRERVASVVEVRAEMPVDPPSPVRRRVRDLHWQIVQRRSQELARHVAVRRALGAAIDGAGAADLVCVEYIGLAPLLPEYRTAPWCLTLHNLPSEMARHAARLAPGRRQRAMERLEERNSRRVEQWAARAYDLTVAVSAQDAALLGGHAAVVPNGVDTERLRASPVPAQPRVLFTGALHTLPNREGVDWFCRQVWPAVRARVPDATLDLVGARPTAQVRDLAAIDGVAIHADVADVQPFLERSRVAVVPLRIGSGTRLKALEAMASGRAVVGTTIGVEGLDVTSGEQLVIADAAPDFADAVVRCLTDGDHAARLGAAGRALVQRRYSWREIAATYAELLERRASFPPGG